MKQSTLKKVIIFSFFIINLVTLPHYGYSWDDQQHLDQGREMYLFLTQGKPFVPFSREGMPAGAYGLILPMLGYLSQVFFSDTLRILPPDVAAHLVILPIATLGLWALMRLTEKYLGKSEALWAGIFLATMPRFIGHLHQNIKDIPSASFFALSILAFINAGEKSTLKNWLIASLVFGSALALKFNAFQIPLIILPCLLIKTIFDQRPNLPAGKAGSKDQRPIAILPMFLLSLGVGFLVWLLLVPALWSDPIKIILLSLDFFKRVWGGNPVLYFGTVYKAGVNVPWHFPLGMLAVTTPLITLALAILGIIISLKKIISSLAMKQPARRSLGEGGFNNGTIYFLVLLWLFVPLSKYFFLKVIVYDDIRHFMEVLFPLALLAAIGTRELVTFCGEATKFLQKTLSRRRILGKKEIDTSPANVFQKILLPTSAKRSLFYLLLVTYFSIPFFRLHPYEMVYFNELVGNEKGVYEKSLFDIDFWGISLREATFWLNNYAKPNQTLYSTFDVFHIINFYKQPDIKTDWNNYLTDDYIIILNRKTFIYPWVADFVKNKKPIYTVERAGVPLSWVYKINH